MYIELGPLSAIGKGNVKISSFCCLNLFFTGLLHKSYDPHHEIFNNVVCATSKVSDQPAHTCSLIRAFASHLKIL